jgi:hypothetical protein
MRLPVRPTCAPDSDGNGSLSAAATLAHPSGADLSELDLVATVRERARLTVDLDILLIEYIQTTRALSTSPRRQFTPKPAPATAPGCRPRSPRRHRRTRGEIEPRSPQARAVRRTKNRHASAPCGDLPTAFRSKLTRRRDTDFGEGGPARRREGAQPGPCEAATLPVVT